MGVKIVVNGSVMRARTVSTVQLSPAFAVAKTAVEFMLKAGEVGEVVGSCCTQLQGMRR